MTKQPGNKFSVGSVFGATVDDRFIGWKTIVPIRQITGELALAESTILSKTTAQEVATVMLKAKNITEARAVIVERFPQAVRTLEARR
jgi:hypothetical protein